MSYEITTAFVQQYGASVMFLVQQKQSRLRRTVRLETGITGKSAFFDQIGVVGGDVAVSVRHGDSPFNPTPHARRRVSMFDFDTGDLIDDFDKLKTLIDPSNPYVMAHAMRLSRAMDSHIISNYFGTAYTDETGSTSTSFLAANQIAVNDWSYGTGSGNVGLTISKLISAKLLLDASENDPDTPRFIVCSAKQIANLLQTTEVTSADYNNIQALVRGNVTNFMGFEFIRTELLPVNGSGYRRVMCFRQDAMLLALAKDINSQVAPRPDKKFVPYAYLCMSIGATRMEEAGCVEIICLEP